MKTLITRIKRLALALCLATPIVSWADGNVAKIGDIEYETVQEALAAYQDGDVIEMQADLPKDGLKVFNRIGTFAFKIDMNYGGTLMNLGAADGYAIYKTDGQIYPYTYDEKNIYYTIVEATGVAKLIHADESFQWYQSVATAFGNAVAGDSMLIKLSGDLAVTEDWGDLPVLDTITFENAEETEDPYTVSYYVGNSGVRYAMKAAKWVAPANVTLKLYTQTVTSINAGTLEVPSEATITLPNFGGGITLDSLKGEGRLACQGRVTNAALNTLLQNTNWKGTMQMGGFDYLSGDIALKIWGNENSTVCFNDANLKFVKTYNSLNGVKALEIGPGGLGLKGEYDSESTIVISAKITGSGNITFGTTGSSLTTYNFTGDFSEFAGNLTMTTDSNTRVYIGNNCAGNGKCISIANGATATVAAGKTWTAQGGFVVLGTLNVAGTLKNGTGSASNNIYGAQNTGKIVYKNAAAICTVGGSYKGEIVIESIAAGGTATEVPLNFGCSDAKLTLEGVTGNAWCAGSDYTVQPEVTLAGNVNFQNGSSGRAVTFRKIAAGTGNLSLKTWNGIGANTGTGITYGFTTLDADKYTGTIQLDASQNNYHLNPALTFNVGDILKAGAKAGDRVLPLTTTGAVLVNLTNAKVNGEAASLEVKEDGIYIVAGFDGGDGNTFTIDSAMQTTLNGWLPPAATLSTVKFEDTGLTYAQGYALGLFDYEKGIIENVKVTIDVVDGKVRLGLNSTPVDGYVVTLKVFEKTSLDDEWPEVAQSCSIGEDITPTSDEAGFYKVGISIADAVAE